MISIHISCTQAITWTIYFLISSVFSRHQGFQVQKKLCIIFFISESGDGKRRVKKNPWSVQISVSDPHSQPRHYFQEALSSSASWAVIVWYSIMQQVCFLFHSFPSLAMSFTCTDSVTGDSHLIVIRQSAVYEGQYFEGGHETNKPIRGERWDQSVIDWLRGRWEGGQRRGGRGRQTEYAYPMRNRGWKGLVATATHLPWCGFIDMRGHRVLGHGGLRAHAHLCVCALITYLHMCVNNLPHTLTLTAPVTTLPLSFFSLFAEVFGFVFSPPLYFSNSCLHFIWQ